MPQPQPTSSVFSAARYDLERTEALLSVALAARTTRPPRTGKLEDRRAPRYRPSDPTGDVATDAHRLDLSKAADKSLREVAQAVELLRRARVRLSEAVDTYDAAQPEDVTEL